MTPCTYGVALTFSKMMVTLMHPCSSAVDDRDAIGILIVYGRTIEMHKHLYCPQRNDRDAQMRSHHY